MRHAARQGHVSGASRGMSRGRLRFTHNLLRGCWYWRGPLLLWPYTRHYGRAGPAAGLKPQAELNLRSNVAPPVTRTEWASRLAVTSGHLLAAVSGSGPRRRPVTGEAGRAGAECGGTATCTAVAGGRTPLPRR